MLYMQKCAKYWTFHKLKQWSNIPQGLLQQTWSGTKTSETADCCIQRQEESLKSVFWFHHNQHRDGLSLIKIPLPAPAPDPLNNSWMDLQKPSLEEVIAQAFDGRPFIQRSPRTWQTVLCILEEKAICDSTSGPADIAPRTFTQHLQQRQICQSAAFERCIVSSILPSRWMRSSSWRDPSTHVAIIKLTSQDPAL